MEKLDILYGFMWKRSGIGSVTDFDYFIPQYLFRALSKIYDLYVFIIIEIRCTTLIYEPLNKALKALHLLKASQALFNTIHLHLLLLPRQLPPQKHKSHPRPPCRIPRNTLHKPQHHLTIRKKIKRPPRRPLLQPSRKIHPPFHLPRRRHCPLIMQEHQ